MKLHFIKAERFVPTQNFRFPIRLALACWLGKDLCNNIFCLVWRLCVIPERGGEDLEKRVNSQIVGKCGSVQHWPNFHSSEKKTLDILHKQAHKQMWISIQICWLISSVTPMRLSSYSCSIDNRALVGVNHTTVTNTFGKK